VERITDKEAMRAWSRARRAAGARIGFVPTMGGLHVGHLSLVDLARERSDVVVVSIYINPTQFDRAEDLAAYPRTLERDAEALAARGVDALYLPSDLYALVGAPHSTWVDVEGLTAGLCGATRPGHFRGVTTVVTKLFHIVEPDVAVFGDKDLQQRRIIERLVRDLDFPIAIVAGPLLRDADGLALSSRNARLDPAARAQALALPEALRWASGEHARGVRDGSRLVATVTQRIRSAGGQVDYVELVDEETLAPSDDLSRPTVLAVAAFFGGVRLIDNVRLAAGS